MLFDEANIDLQKSGLSPEDIRARVASVPELSACGLNDGVKGYVIPYYNLVGRPAAFYRLRLFDTAAKYMQPGQTSNHVYFPKNLMSTLNSIEYLNRIKEKDQRKYIILCEGEKKAACATMLGFPSVAFGGVDSWRNKTLLLPAQTDFSRVSNQKTLISAKLPSSQDEILEISDSVLAYGLLDLIDYVISNDLHVIVIYDSDSYGVKPEVQRAAAALGFELRYRGVPFGNIHQIVLPTNESMEDKLGLDDFLVSPGGPELLDQLITNMFQKAYSFPRHPNPKDFVNRKLQRARISRKECQQIGIAILSDLDANGSRLRSKEEQQMYYFDNRTRRLMRVSFNLSQSSVLHGTAFGQLLYINYGLSSADGNVLTWLDIQFNSEEPIEEVTPNRVIGVQKVSRVNRSGSTLRQEIRHAVRYQINDGQYVKVGDVPLSVNGASNSHIKVLDNGSEGFMFLSDQVERIDAGELLSCIDKQRAKPLTPWWLEVLNDVRLKDSQDNQTKTALMLLYYISPWLNKWQGMQLPIELVIGEPGSGKSSLYEHRLNILTGNPELRNAPSDLKDWHASITNTGGLHVTDNVQLVNRDLRQRLSDELCRIVTEPNPHIEMRKLYSNNELIRIPIHSNFAITSIQQPFQNADLIQRAIKIELDKSAVEGDVEYDSDWVFNQMDRFGGRVEWIAHHLLVLEKFFKLYAIHWDPKYRALHRLIHFEQTMRIMAKVFNLDDAWIPTYLAGTTEKNISQADWVMEGLLAFSDSMKEKYAEKDLNNLSFATSLIVNWCEEQDDYKDNSILTNTRALGRYIQTNKHMVKSTAKIAEAGSRHNRIVYRIEMN